MDYFKFLSMVFGVLMFLGGLGMSFQPRALDSWIGKLYPEERPGWLIAAGAVILVLTVWTWYQFLTRASMEAFVVTLVVSLTMTKIALAALFYKNFRGFTKALIKEPLAFRVVMMSSAAVGAALLALGFLI